MQLKANEIRGFNYVPSTAHNDIEFWRDYDPQLVENELAYAKRLSLNTARVFLSIAVYDKEPEKFLSRLRHFVRTAFALGIYTMPVVFDSCFDEVQPEYDIQINQWVANPGTLKLDVDFYPHGERYCADIAKALANEPGLLLWDIMNEPLQTTYIFNAPDDVRAKREEKIWKFVRHFCREMKRIDPKHFVTSGIAFVHQMPNIADYVDILTYHDYSATRAAMQDAIDAAFMYAEKYNKPVFNSEMSCLARCNPYDVSIELHERNHMGFVLWELMIGCSLWTDIHGVVYPNGTVRDPSIAAALIGFYRNRTPNTIMPNIDKEGACRRYLNRAKELLSTDAPRNEILECAEALANALEAGEWVAMNTPPSAKVLALSAQPESSIHCARELLYELSQITLKVCNLL